MKKMEHGIIGANKRNLGVAGVAAMLFDKKLRLAKDEYLSERKNWKLTVCVFYY